MKAPGNKYYFWGYSLIARFARQYQGETSLATSRYPTHFPTSWNSAVSGEFPPVTPYDNDVDSYGGIFL